LENCALLDSYAANIGTYFLTTNHILPQLAA